MYSYTRNLSKKGKHVSNPIAWTLKFTEKKYERKREELPFIFLDTKAFLRNKMAMVKPS